MNAASPLFSPSPLLQAASRRKTCHNRVTGCGLCTECRRTANGHRRSALAKTNYSEPLAVFIALKHFLPFLHHCHILISSDCSTETPHIAPSAPSRWDQHRLAQSLTQRAFLTLSVTTPGLRLLAFDHNYIYRVIVILWLFYLQCIDNMAGVGCVANVQYHNSYLMERWPLFHQLPIKPWFLPAEFLMGESY